MKTLMRKHEIKDCGEEKFTMRTVAEEEIPYQEANKILEQQRLQLTKVEAQKTQLEDYVKRQGWLEDVKGLDEAIGFQKALVQTFEAGVEKYNEQLVKRGIEVIRREKLKTSYARSSGDARMVRRNQILNDVRAELGLDDVASPVMVELRKRFEEVK